MLKTNAHLAVLDENDTNKNNIFDYYAIRHIKYHQVCLADYVSEYTDAIIF